MFQKLTCVQEGVLRRGAFLFFLFLIMCLPACAAQREESAVHRTPVLPMEHTSLALAPEWQDLRARLAADGLAGTEVDVLLASLGPRTESPMGRKMVELYKKNFLPRPPSKKPARDAVYKGVVTTANARLCKTFIQEHKAAFDQAYRRYGVPPSVACALLFVETRLGKYLGDVQENALQTLASMAESRTLESIPSWYGKMPGYEAHAAWFAEIMPKRADWAYRETRALVLYMLDNGIQADMLPGSIYGAIGLCQFMPSNIRPYGVDGNGDGVINLYVPDDAVASLANYLARHGWKAKSSKEARHKVLMRYNKSTVYANTILALADRVDRLRTPAQGTAGR